MRWLWGSDAPLPLGGGNLGRGVQSRQGSPKIDLGGHWKLQEGAVQGGARGDPQEGGALASVQSAHVPAWCKRRPSWGKGELGRSFGSGISCCTPPAGDACTRTPGGLFPTPRSRAFPLVSPSASKSCRKRLVQGNVGASSSHVCVCVCAQEPAAKVSSPILACCDESSGHVQRNLVKTSHDLASNLVPTAISFSSAS